jgi:hypothetical protein
LGHGYDSAYVLNQFSSSDENNKNVNPTITNGLTYIPDERNTSGDTRYIGVPTGPTINFFSYLIRSRRRRRVMAQRNTKSPTHELIETTPILPSDR